MTEEFSYENDPLDSSECSSAEEDIEKSENIIESFHDAEDLEKKYLSALEFKSDTSSNIPFKNSSQVKSPSTIGSVSHEPDRNDLSSTPEKTQYENNQPLNPICNAIGNIEDVALSLKSLKSWEVESANNLIQGTSKLRETSSKVNLPSFDFKSIRDPFTECVDRLGIGSSNRADHFSVPANNTAPMKRNYHKAPGDDTLPVNKTSFHKHEDIRFKTDHQKQELSPNGGGGGGWQVMLSGTGNKNVILRPGDHSKIGVAAVIEIPLDFVLEKCLLEEIQLQYP